MTHLFQRLNAVLGLFHDESQLGEHHIKKLKVKLLIVHDKNFFPRIHFYLRFLLGAACGHRPLRRPRVLEPSSGDARFCGRFLTAKSSC